MKKFLLSICVAIICAGSAFAQKGVKAVGVNFSYGTEIENIGFGVKGQYGLTDALRLEGSFDYFLKKNYLDMFDINLNAHYLFPVAEKISVYPLAGFSYTSWGFSLDDFADDLGLSDYYDDEDDDSSREGKFGVNIGCGAQYDLTDKISISAEAKYQIINTFDQLVFGVGVAYKF